MSGGGGEQATEQEIQATASGKAKKLGAMEAMRPGLSAYQDKMNRDDSARLGGMANADVMQAAGEDQSGKILASGAGVAQKQIGGELGKSLGSATRAALGREDQMREGYTNLGLGQESEGADSLKSGARAAAEVNAAEAEAKATRQDAMLGAAIGMGGSYALDKYDKAAQAASAKSKALKTGRGGMYAKGTWEKSQRDNRLGHKLYDWFGD